MAPFYSSVPVSQSAQYHGHETEAAIQNSAVIHLLFTPALFSLCQNVSVKKTYSTLVVYHYFIVYCFYSWYIRRKSTAINCFPKMCYFCFLRLCVSCFTSVSSQCSCVLCSCVKLSYFLCASRLVTVVSIDSSEKQVHLVYSTYWLDSLRSFKFVIFLLWRYHTLKMCLKWV